MITFKDIAIMRFNCIHQEIESTGNQLWEHDNEWLSTNDAIVQNIIDTFPIEKAQKEVIDNIDGYANKIRDSILLGVSSTEIAGWPVKLAEAQAFTKTNESLSAPMLLVEANTRKSDLPYLVSKVLAKADKLAYINALISGIAGKHGDAIKALSTFSEIAGYDWSIDWPI